MTDLDTAGGVLEAAQRRAAERLLAEEGAKRRHLVVYLSGAHAYGFPSPDSDLELKAVHLEPTARLLGLSPPAAHAVRLEVFGGIEVDYSSNELGAVVQGILAGNGNYLERILGPTALVTSSEHAALRPLVLRAVSRNAYRHYAGFARNQLMQVERSEAPTAKKVLYVLRTALTGTHLLATGELVADLTQLLDRYGFGRASELVAAKKQGEQTVLAPGERDYWVAEAGRALARLEAAHEESVLPAEPQNRGELEDWLLELRRASW
jgi:predicted nucleotidyltransferase